MPLPPGRINDLLAAPLNIVMQEALAVVAAHRIPCGGERRRAFGYPAPPKDVDAIGSASVPGTPSSQGWQTLASHVVPSGHRAEISAFGVEAEDDDYTGFHFRVLVNGNPLAPWQDTTWPPGGMRPDQMRHCHIELGPKSTIAVQAYHTGSDTREVYARLVGVEWPC